MALTTAIERALTDKKLRDRLADAAWEAGRTLPTWHETARRIAAEERAEKKKRQW